MASEKQKTKTGTFLVIKTLCFQYRGHRFNPWLRNCDPTCCVVWAKKKKRYKNETPLQRLLIHIQSDKRGSPS